MSAAGSAPPPRWHGRDDGDGPEHRRWHHLVRPGPPPPGGRVVALVGFASDEGVSRNGGRRGAAEGPAALRGALAPIAVRDPLPVHDLGDVTVHDGDLEGAQIALGAVVGDLVGAGHLPVVLGGGHEVAFGTHLGLDRLHASGARVGVLNLDAHFDLRADPVPSSGTPFRQILDRWNARYTVLGISETANTRALFDAAEQRDVRYLLDDDCGLLNRRSVVDTAHRFLDEVDAVHLTVDLDVLPAHVAPGVSAPAALGVAPEIVQAVCDTVAASGKLAALDVAELNPHFDLDARTARIAARLVHRMVTRLLPPPTWSVLS